MISGGDYYGINEEEFDVKDDEAVIGAEAMETAKNGIYSQFLPSPKYILLPVITTLGCY